MTGTQSAYADTSVSGNDSRDEYIGTDAILLTTNFEGSQRGKSQAAVCDGCRWRVTVLCPSDIAILDANPSAVIVNPHPCPADTNRHCPAGSRRLNVYFADTSTAPLRRIGSTCVGPSGPLRTVTAHRWARDAQRAHLPPLTLRLSHATALVGMQVAGTVGPTASHRWTLQVGGHSVTVTARARWTIDWGDGVTGYSSRQRVTHAWGRAGTRVVGVHCEWRARYWVDGSGPWTVKEVIRQEAASQVEVIGAFTRLVPAG